MSDETLLVFGCAVSFVVLGGFYLYLREAFARGHASREASVELGAELKPHAEVHS